MAPLILIKEDMMPFCPKCWQEYPKDFIACKVCDVPLTDEKPHEHESQKDSKPPQTPPKSESPKTKKK